MIPAATERDQLFKTFGRAWFRRDATLLYEVVTPDFIWESIDGDGRVQHITGREAVAQALAATAEGPKRRFENVVYHHAPEATFMTFRLIEIDAAGHTTRTEDGIERYTFRDGRIALKDVYRKVAG